MNAKEAIRQAIEGSEFIASGYLADLTDAELLVRPVPGANHIAWQLGHLAIAEHMLIDTAFPGSMPPLPAGFKERYTNETATSDDPKSFDSKDELLKVRAEQRAGTLKALESASDAQLDGPGPEKFRKFCPSVATLFLLQGNHTTMHAGQWAVVRRKLGRPPLF